MVEGAGRVVGSLVGVGTEGVPLGLDEVLGQPGGPAGVEVTEGTAERRQRNAPGRTGTHHHPQSGISQVYLPGISKCQNNT